MASLTLQDLLDGARAKLARLDPAQAASAMRDGATLVDIRSDRQIDADGTIPGALLIARNVLEWRLAPDSGHRHPRAPEPQDQVVVICDTGYASSLAAAALQELGFLRATDLDGGFQAWRAAGLPITPPEPK